LLEPAHGALACYCAVWEIFQRGCARTFFWRRNSGISRQQSGGNVQTGGIDTSRIEAMIAQLKAAATKPQAIAPTEVSAAKVNFADALKASLDSVSATQQKSAALGRSFTSGDDKVSLSDVMIAAQKSSIAFQATVQVRNKLVTAYNEIMNMQV
jgi:flagellar hook-basal body complex protein FliE